jgi:hypothetical protein
MIEIQAQIIQQQFELDIKKAEAAMQKKAEEISKEAEKAKED